MDKYLPQQQKLPICREKLWSQLSEIHGYAQGFPQGMGVRIGARPLAGCGGRRAAPNGETVNSSYTPFRCSTRRKNVYTARPLPWWNRLRPAGTTTRNGGSMQERRETRETRTETETETAPTPASPTQPQPELPDPRPDDDDLVDDE